MIAAKKMLLAGRPMPNGQAAFTTPGTFSWTCPAGVREVCVVAVGAGSWASGITGGSGGALAWKNKIKVIPGQTYTVVVGAAPANPNTPGGRSYFIDPSIVSAEGGANNNVPSTFTGDGGGRGGIGGSASGSQVGMGGGGGAGGYAGDGGGGQGVSGNQDGAGTRFGGSSGAGGAAGGGRSYLTYQESSFPREGGRPGGGVGIMGQGANGGLAAGPDGGGGGGSGGENGTLSAAGRYGGGFGSGQTDANSRAGGGAVRIIWGRNRAFPATKTGDL